MNNFPFGTVAVIALLVLLLVVNRKAHLID